MHQFQEKYVLQYDSLNFIESCSYRLIKVLAGLCHFLRCLLRYITVNMERGIQFHKSFEYMPAIYSEGFTESEEIVPLPGACHNGIGQRCLRSQDATC